MAFENLENIISLLCNIVGLLYCAFRFIESPKRGYRLIIIFFLANILSEYYWTVYELIMGSYPNVSEFAAYLGWNVAFFVLLVSVFLFRNKNSRRYFHPVMLIPVLLNVPQFILYISYGGILNNIWQVGTTTVTMVLCLQEIMYYFKHRSEYRSFPLISMFVLVFLMLQYGMWSASCFDWPSELLNPYFYCTVFGSVLTLFFGYGIKKHYENEGSESTAYNAPEMRLQVLIQTIVTLVIVGVCAAGFFLAYGLKDSLVTGVGDTVNETKLVLLLFAISAVLILIVMILLLVLTKRYRHIMSIRNKWNENKRSKLNFIVTIVVTLALMGFAVFYNTVVLYRASVVSVYEDGQKEIRSTATDLESYLTVAMTTLRVTADSVDLMEENGNSIEEIRQYIVDETRNLAEQFDENFTGLYAYINGEYLDGLNWEPPEGYDPTERDWYKIALEGNGETVLVSPYVDAQTGSVVITVGRSITSSVNSSSGQSGNVVCLDVIVNHLKDVAKNVSIAGKGYGMVVNGDGFIIAHADDDITGKNVADVYGQDLLDTIINANSDMITADIDGEEHSLFVSSVMNQWYAVIVIGNSELLGSTYSQLAINIMVSLITFCLVAFFYYTGYKSEKIYGEKVEEMNLQVVTALATAIDAKDEYTNGHSSRVAEYSKLIATRAGYSKAEQDEIYMMGLLHDVGKIGMPDNVINKPSTLTAEEYELIKKHPVIGEEILKTIKERPKLAEGARWHHERYGGGGYPDGIAGESIPEQARIIAVADAYDAMTSRRSYREIMSQAKVRSEIETGSGTQFDPRFASIMLQMIDEDKEFTMREK